MTLNYYWSESHLCWDNSTSKPTRCWTPKKEIYHPMDPKTQDKTYRLRRKAFRDTALIFSFHLLKPFKENFLTEHQSPLNDILIVQKNYPEAATCAFTSELLLPLTAFPQRYRNSSLVKRRKPRKAVSLKTFTHSKTPEPVISMQASLAGMQYGHLFKAYLPSTLQWGHWDQVTHNRSQRGKAGTQKVFSSLAG